MTALSLPPTNLVTRSDSPLPDDALSASRFAARHADIQAALASNPSATEREQLKRDIIALFKEVDAEVTLLTALKESVKQLASQWKSVDTGQPMAAPSTLTANAASASAPKATPAARPAISMRVDHLGASTFVEKGWTKLSVGDASGAEVALRRALELAPGDNEAESLLGWALMLQQQYDTALLTFHNVLLRDPEHALARTNVGYICLRKQIYGEAIEHLSHAIRLDTDRKATLYAHLYLGMVYREREMFDDAEAFFRRALELGPNLLQAWYELGRARWFAKRPDDAKSAWREGAAANKFNPWGKRCAEMLAFVEAGGAPPRGD